MFKNTKLYGTILGIILFIILIAGLTYAYFTWTSSNINFSIESDCFVVNYVKGQNISNNNMFVINEKDFLDGNKITITEGMALTTVRMGIDSSCNVTGTATIKIDVSLLSDSFITDKGNSVGALKYKVVEYSSSEHPTVTTDALKETSFMVKGSGEITSREKINLYSTPINNSSIKEYIIIFYLDEVLIQNDAASATFYGTISAEVVQKG